MCVVTLSGMISALSAIDPDRLENVPAADVIRLIQWADGFPWELHFRGLVYPTPDRILETGIKHVFGLPEPGLPPVRAPQTEAELRRAQFAKQSARARRLLAARDGMACKVCGCSDGLTVDHILPMSRGGSNDLDNLQLLCKSCNSSKGARTMAEWLGIEA